MHILDLRNKKSESKIQIRRPYRFTSLLFGFAFLAFLTLNAVFAWTNPSVAPPGGSPGPIPVSSGGTGTTTLSGVLVGNGTSAFTTKANPSGAFVGTTDIQTLTNKTIDKALNTLTGIASSGANSDITSLSGLSTALSVAQGGTGATTLSGALMGNGTGAFAAVAPGASGNVLKSDGINWTSGVAPGASWSQFTWAGVGTTPGGDGTAYCTFSCPAGKVAWDYKGTVSCPSVGTCFNNITWARTAWPDYWYATDYFGSSGATVGHSGGWTCTPQGSFLCGPQ